MDRINKIQEGYNKKASRCRGGKGRQGITKIANKCLSCRVRGLGEKQRNIKGHEVRSKKKTPKGKGKKYVYIVKMKNRGRKNGNKKGQKE